MYTRSKGHETGTRLSSSELDLRLKLNGGKISSSRRLRSAGTPTCLHFGVERRKKHPGCFFCSQCDWFEDEYKINKKIKLGSAKYKCTALHDNWIMPSRMLQEEDFASNNVPKKRSKTSSIMANNTSGAIASTGNVSGTTLYNVESLIEIGHDDDSTSTSTRSSSMKQNSNTKSGRMTSTSTITKNSFVRAIKKGTTATTTLYDIEKEVLELESDDEATYSTNSSTGIMEQTTNNEAGKKTIITNMNKNSEDTFCNSTSTNTRRTYISQNDFHRNANDDYDVSIEDFEQLKQDLQTRFSELKNKSETLQEQHTEMKQNLAAKQTKISKECSYYKTKASTYKNKHSSAKNDQQLPTSFSNLPSYVGQFMSTIKQFSNTKNRNKEKLAENIVDLIWKDDFLDGFFVECLIRRCKFWLRTNVFSPERILEAMDNNGGHLSMTAIEILRTIETNGEKNCMDTVLPSSTPIKRVCKEVDKYCQQVLPFEMGTMKEGGEFAKFKAEHVLPLMYKAYGLEDEATKRPIKVNTSMDSAKISTRISHTTLGLKMADRMARDPKTGKLLVGTMDDNATLQSKHHCFPLKFALVKETNSTYAQFKDVLDELKELFLEGIPKLRGFKPPKTSLNADMAATWKILGVGHAAKNCKYPCHLCAVHDDNLVIPHGINCDRWCRQLHFGDDSIKCYHKDLLDEQNVKKLKETLEEMSEGIETLMPHLEKLKKETIIDIDEDPRGIIVLNSERNPKSIHFNTKNKYNTQDVIFQFSRNVALDLQLRKLSLSGNLEERKERLRMQLIEEWILRKTKESLEHADKMDTSQFLLMQCVPCILHLENRVGIKILSMILSEGIKNAASFKILKEEVNVKSRGASKKCSRIYVEQIHKILTQEIWGTRDRPATWNVPYNDKDQTLEAISICNQSTREVLSKINVLIDKSISDNDRKEKYKACIEHYINAMNILRKKKDLTNEEIFEFQFEIDKFSNLWIGLNQRAGITNYIHLLASGHIGDFLMHYRNLYEHSQQGWEALNSMLKVFFFRRTTRGGGNGDGSKVRQIARWLARRMIWLTKIDYKTILDANKKYDEQMESILEENEEDLEYDEQIESILDENVEDLEEDDFCHEHSEEIFEPLQT